MRSDNTPSFLWQSASLLILICALALAPTGASAQQDPPEAPPETNSPSSPDSTTPIKIQYAGYLQDDSGEPISGIFPLTFKLYTNQLATGSIWQEFHFVAVVDGQYHLDLGTHAPLMQNQLEGKRWIGVEFDTEGEILRDQLIVTLPDATQPGRLRPAGANRSSTFAEVSERANYAEHAARADRADKLGELDAEAIEKLSNLALERLGEHITDPEAHNGGKSGKKVGTERKLMDPRAGGRGGEPYKIHCPPGFVVTGLEGGAGRMVDSLQVVCSPIQ